MPTGRTPHRDTFSYASWVLDRIEATRRLTHLAIACGALSPALGLPGWRRSTDRTSLREKSLLSGNLTGNFAILGIPKAIPDRARLFLIKKVLCCSGFSRNSLRELTGKLVGLAGKSQRASGNVVEKAPYGRQNLFSLTWPPYPSVPTGVFTAPAMDRCVGQDTNPPSQGNRTDHANPLSGRNDIDGTGVLNRDEHGE